jgi:hypothetical protein
MTGFPLDSCPGWCPATLGECSTRGAPVRIISLDLQHGYFDVKILAFEDNGCS